MVFRCIICYFCTKFDKSLETVETFEVFDAKKYLYTKRLNSAVF